MNADGSGVKQLTHNPRWDGIRDYAGCFTPDDKNIIYIEGPIGEISLLSERMALVKNSFPRKYRSTSVETLEATVRWMIERLEAPDEDSQ